MASQTTVVALSGLGIGINTAYTVAHGYDPFPTVLAGAIFMGGCVIVGSANAELGAALAGVYLLGTLIFRGDYFIGFLQDLTKSAPAPAQHKTKKG